MGWYQKPGCTPRGSLTDHFLKSMRQNDLRGIHSTSYLSTTSLIFLKAYVIISREMFISIPVGLMG